MSVARVVLLHLFLFVACAQGRKGIGGTEQDWGYITVRPSAHMFWWLYYTTCTDVSNYTDRPLIIWLQGGPGMPSSGYGNFLEIGPHNSSFYKREGSFVDNFNVLFVDNPVGVGYSYVSDSATKLVTNGAEIGEDLYSFFKVFITERHPEFKNVPIYVFGESYGGKMATEFVYALTQKRKSEKVNLCNLKGLALGAAYISPMDYVNHYAPLALNLGLVDKRGFTRIDELTKQIQVLINKKEFEKAHDTQNTITDWLCFETFGIDLYNILAKTNATRIPQVWDYKPLFENIMNNEVRDTLNITANVTWKFVGDDVYKSLKPDVIKSITHKVETILNTTDVKIIVYNGILDFLVNTAGTISWLDSLKWQGRERWFNASQSALILDEVTEGYSKRVDNLVFYAVLRAGHSVPIDKLPVVNEILRLELLN
ncbi:hypothetical protein MTP99_001058 [Tenebrio molitor]|nr:hypothetical protein MTP99_001058 [Tenebrio molitor]